MKTIATVILIFACYIIWQRWDTKNLQTFCSKLKPGTSVSSLPVLAETYHLDSRWLTKDGIVSKETTTAVIYLPAKSTIGDVVCKIEHNKTMVLSTTFEVD